ncbi:MAG: carbon-nitrogen hydrolase family protein [Verrucomicrobiota bacterium]
MLQGLDAALAQYPDTRLFLLPEYTFFGAPPKDFTDWCRRHQRHLIAGGRDYAPGLFNSRGLRAYFNTAWVIGPEGTVVHRQAKSMPIQFFDDGMPAATQQVWNSPWGRLGICICYDQNYSIVTDPLAEQDMQALLIPTMDVIQWGPYQHELSARLAATRAAEYGVPVFRLASSGVSVVHDSRGRLEAKGSVPGQGEIISAVIRLSDHARRPWDRLPARISVVASAFLVCLALALSFVDERRRLRAARELKAGKPAAM